MLAPSSQLPTNSETAPVLSHVSKSSSRMLLPGLFLMIGLALGYVIGQQQSLRMLRSDDSGTPLVVDWRTPDEPESADICMTDAKICADGSAVGRQGPNCEFAMCPGEEPSTTPAASPRNDMVSDGAASSMPAQNITIPADWKKQSATDWGFLFTTDMSVPPGYTFTYSGSEFTIANANNTDMWDLSTSIFIGKNELQNYYTGGSRRAWYTAFLRGDFEPIPRGDSFPKSIIASVQEYPIGNTSYLRVIVRTLAQNGTPQRDEVVYLYEQNGILHMLKFLSGTSEEANSLIAKNMGVILHSLQTHRDTGRE